MRRQEGGRERNGRDDKTEHFLRWRERRRKEDNGRGSEHPLRFNAMLDAVCVSSSSPPLPRRLSDFVPLFLPLCGHFYAILPALLSNRNPYENYVRDRKREWGSERMTRRGKRKERREPERE